jgi:hypothetical protein
MSNSRYIVINPRKKEKSYNLRIGKPAGRCIKCLTPENYHKEEGVID